MAQRHSALIVVDLLNDFLARGGYYDEIARLTDASGGKLSPSDIDGLARLHRHPPSSCVIRDGYRELVAGVANVAAAALAREMATVFVRTAYDPASRHRPPLFTVSPQRQDYACHPGSWGAEFVDPIKRLTSDRSAKVVEKPTYDAFFATDLRSFLQSRAIDTLYLAGVETNVCVLFTALTALTNGFATVVIEDGVATSLPALQEPALRIIEVAKGRRIRQRDFLALLERE